jgi:hypothetical protein
MESSGSAWVLFSEASASHPTAEWYPACRPAVFRSACGRDVTTTSSSFKGFRKTEIPGSIEVAVHLPIGRHDNPSADTEIVVLPQSIFRRSDGGAWALSS